MRLTGFEHVENSFFRVNFKAPVLHSISDLTLVEPMIEFFYSAYFSLIIWVGNSELRVSLLRSKPKASHTRLMSKYEIVEEKSWKKLKHVHGNTKRERP